MKSQNLIILLIAAAGAYYLYTKKKNPATGMNFLPTNDSELIDYAHASINAGDVKAIENATTQAVDYYMNDPYGKKNSQGDYFSETSYAGLN